MNRKKNKQIQFSKLYRKSKANDLSTQKPI